MQKNKTCLTEVAQPSSNHQNASLSQNITEKFITLLNDTFEASPALETANTLTEIKSKLPIIFSLFSLEPWTRTLNIGFITEVCEIPILINAIVASIQLRLSYIVDPDEKLKEVQRAAFFKLCINYLKEVRVKKILFLLNCIEQSTEEEIRKKAQETLLELSKAHPVNAEDFDCLLNNLEKLALEDNLMRGVTFILEGQPLLELKKCYHYYIRFKDQYQKRLGHTEYESTYSALLLKITQQLEAHTQKAFLMAPIPKDELIKAYELDWYTLCFGHDVCTFLDNCRRGEDEAVACYLEAHASQLDCNTHILHMALYYALSFEDRMPAFPYTARVNLDEHPLPENYTSAHVRVVEQLLTHFERLELKLDNRYQSNTLISCRLPKERVLDFENKPYSLKQAAIHLNIDMLNTLLQRKVDSLFNASFLSVLELFVSSWETYSSDEQVICQAILAILFKEQQDKQILTQAEIDDGFSFVLHEQKFPLIAAFFSSGLLQTNMHFLAPIAQSLEKDDRDPTLEKNKEWLRSMFMSLLYHIHLPFSLREKKRSFSHTMNELEKMRDRVSEQNELFSSITLAEKPDLEEKGFLTYLNILNAFIQQLAENEELITGIAPRLQEEKAQPAENTAPRPKPKSKAPPKPKIVATPEEAALEDSRIRNIKEAQKQFAIAAAHKRSEAKALAQAAQQMAAEEKAAKKLLREEKKKAVREERERELKEKEKAQQAEQLANTIKTQVSTSASNEITPNLPLATPTLLEKEKIAELLNNPIVQFGFEVFAEHAALLTGGAPRDTLCKHTKKPTDFDFVTDLAPDAVMEQLKQLASKGSQYAPNFTARKSNQTNLITVRLNDVDLQEIAHLDIVCARNFSTLEEDAKHKDSPCNTLYLNKNGTVFLGHPDSLEDVRNAISRSSQGEWRITFSVPPPSTPEKEGANAYWYAELNPYRIMRNIERVIDGFDIHDERGFTSCARTLFLVQKGKDKVHQIRRILQRCQQNGRPFSDLFDILLKYQFLDETQRKKLSSFTFETCSASRLLQAICDASLSPCEQPNTSQNRYSFMPQAGTSAQPRANAPKT